MAEFIESGSHPYEMHRLVLHEVSPWKANLKNKKILDIGCGKGIYGFLLKADKGADSLVGIDISLQNLLFCKEHKIYNLLIRGDIRRLPFKDKTFDIVLASEVIEHMKKEEGTLLLKELERICKEKIILTTPNGYWPQSNIGNNPHEIHISGWSCSDFKKEGFKAYGFGSRFFNRHKIMRYVLMYMLTPITYFLPMFGEFLIVTKSVDKRKRRLL